MSLVAKAARGVTGPNTGDVVGVDHGAPAYGRPMETSAPAQKHPGDEFIHAGGGAGLVLIQLSALIPGLLPTVALGVLFAAVLVVPLIALALAVGVLVAIPWSLWRVMAAVTGSHRRREDPSRDRRR